MRRSLHCTGFYTVSVLRKLRLMYHFRLNKRKEAGLLGGGGKGEGGTIGK